MQIVPQYRHDKAEYQEKYYRNRESFDDVRFQIAHFNARLFLAILPSVNPGLSDTFA
jgi:hypothetical protein